MPIMSSHVPALEMGVEFLLEHCELPIILGSPWRCVTHEISSVT